jgi:hypothetical protein
MHISFKIIKFLLHSTLLNMFRIPLCPLSGASLYCTCSLWSPCGVVSVPSSSPVLLLLLRNWMTQPKLHHTVSRGCMCSRGKLLMMDTVVSETSSSPVLLLLLRNWMTQPKPHHTVTRGCMCSRGKLLMMDTVVPETC